MTLVESGQTSDSSYLYQQAKQRLAYLEQRNHKIICMIQQGETNSHISRMLGISPQMAQLYRSSMLS